MPTTRKLSGATTPLVEDQDDGTHIPIVKTTGGGGGGGGDASAANQTTQIGLETAIRDRLINGGPATGAGVINPTTQRMTLADDDMAVVDLEAIKTATGTPADAAWDTAAATATVVAASKASASALGTRTDAAAGSDTGTFSFLSLFKRFLSAKLPAVLGLTAPANSFPIVQALRFVQTGPAAQTALGTDLLTGNANGWFDALGYNFAQFYIAVTAGVSAGAVTIEGTNDNTVTTAEVVLQCWDPNAFPATNPISAYTLAANARRHFNSVIGCRYIRLRISTAVVGGSVQGSAILSQAAVPPQHQALACVGGTTQGGTITNPLVIGIESRTTARTASGDAQATRPIGDKLGRTVIVDGQIRELRDMSARVTLTTTTETTIIAAVAAVTNDIRWLLLSNESATQVRIDLRTTTAGTVVASPVLTPGQTIAIPIPGGLKQAAVNTNWTAQLSTAVTSVYITPLSERVS